MKLISCGKLTFTSLLYLFLFLLFFISDLLINFGLISNKESILECNVAGISAILSGLPKIIYDLYAKFTSNKNPTNKCTLSGKSKFTYVSTNPSHTQICLIILLMFCLATVHIAQNLFFIFLKKKESFNYLIDLLAFNGSVMLINYLGPFRKFYLHHFIAMIFVIVGTIIAEITSVKFTIWIIIDFCNGIVLAFIFSGIKYIMEKKFIHPLSFLFYYGIMCLGLLWCSSFICYYAQINEDFTMHFNNLSKEFQEIFSTSKQIIYEIIKLLFYCGINVFYYQIIYYENPLNCHVIEHCSYFIVYLLYYSFIEFKGNAEFYQYLIGTPIMLIGALMLLEIYECHCFRLHEQTKRAIELRSSEESDNNGIEILIDDRDRLIY